MNVQHKNLAAGKWGKMPFLEQMANVGSEVERALKWKEKNNKEYSSLAFDRAIELLDLTLADRKNISRLRELARVRETLADYFAFENEYGSDSKSWQKYFYLFTYAARVAGI